MAMEAVIRELQDTMAVMSHVQALQAEALKDRAEWLANHDKRQLEHQRRLDENEQWWARHKEAMAEFDEKLNALIPIVDSLIRGKQQ